MTYHGADCVVENRMVRKREDRLYEGGLYHLLIDPALVRLRRLIRGQVKPGTTLIDFGCGTGELLFFLADWCSDLVGVEASKRMWSYGSRRARSRGHNKVRLIYGDGARLDNLPTGSFDYATSCMVLHEMPGSQRLPVLREMQRLARTLILVDYRVPPPPNLEARIYRLVERLGGRHHYRNFRSFLNTGGLPPLLKELGLPIREEISFHRQCFQLVQAG